MVDFLQHIKAGHFAVTWDFAINETTLVGFQGCVGRYGPGYGHDEHKSDIKRKFGIHEPGFQLQKDGITLDFTIHTREGFDFLCKFAETHGYEKPVVVYTKIKMQIKNPEELRIAQIHNQNLQERVKNLIGQLEQLTDLCLDETEYEIEEWIDEDQYYNWQQKERYPMYKITEHNLDRVQSIFYDSNIMRDC